MVISSRGQKQTHTKAFLLKLSSPDFKCVTGLTSLDTHPNFQMQVQTANPSYFLVNHTIGFSVKMKKRKKKMVFIFGFMFEYIPTILI